METEIPTHRTRALVRTEEATATVARLRKTKLGQPMAAGTVTPKPQSLTGRRRLAPATIWTRAFWDWRRPSVRRYSEAFCGSTGAPTSLTALPPSLDPRSKSVISGMNDLGHNSELTAPAGCVIVLPEANSGDPLL